MLNEADIKAKQPRGICKTRYDALQRLLRVDEKGSVALEEKIPDQPLIVLGVD